jgi:hypothetical protein
VAAPGHTQRLVLTDGSQLIGRIVSIDSASVQFESSLGVTTIPIRAIVALRDEGSGAVRNGRYFFRNPNATRLIFAPTGRMLAKGEGYVSDFWVFFPGVASGVSDHFTLGGGASLLPGIDFTEQIFYLTPKVGVIQKERFNAAVGALATSVPTFDDGSSRESAGLLYGVATWGSVDQSLTTGVGYGYIGGTLANRPVLMAGGESRMSPRLSFVTENYLFPGGAGLVSAAIRFMGQDIAVDLGLSRPVNTEEAVTIPLLNFVWKW